MKRFVGVLFLCAAMCGVAGCDSAVDQDEVPAQAEVSELLCSDPQGSEAAFAELDMLAEHGPIAVSQRQTDALRGFVEQGGHDGWCHDRFRPGSADYPNIRLTGPILPIARDGDSAGQVTAFTTHSRVRVYYSQAMVAWLREGRQGQVPDGAVMVKEMFPTPTNKKPDVDGAKPDGWAVMIKDSQASHDGWLWYLRYRNNNDTCPAPFEAAQ